MSHEEREHRSAPVLTKEQEDALRANTTAGDQDTIHSAGVGAWGRIWATMDAVRAERDAALAVLRAISNQPCRQSYLHETRPCARGIECAPCHAMKAVAKEVQP